MTHSHLIEQGRRVLSLLFFVMEEREKTVKVGIGKVKRETEKEKRGKTEMEKGTEKMRKMWEKKGKKGEKKERENDHLQWRGQERLIGMIFQNHVF